MPVSNGDPIMTSRLAIETEYFREGEAASATGQTQGERPIMNDRGQFLCPNFAGAADRFGRFWQKGLTQRRGAPARAIATPNNLI
jgi:hypothetical protein